MEDLFIFFYSELRKIDLSFTRYLINEIDWEGRLSAITGARGTGKTTMILQHIKQTFGNSPKEVLYVSADNIWFLGNRLFDLASDFEKQGGKYLFVDEVHKYENWSQEIKNIYDCFSSLKVVITGSSMLQIYKGNADLSRRAVHYFLRGLSFREFLKYDQNVEFEKFTLEDIVQNHIEIAGGFNEKIRPLPLFNTYLKQGYYPYYKSDKQFYLSKLANTVNLILEMDLPSVETIEMYSIRKIKKLLWIISKSVPFTPNITDLAKNLNVSRNSLLNYLTILERGGLINLLQSNTKSIKSLAKPDKIFLNNTNQIYAFDTNKPDIGNLRETFFYNQLQAICEVTSAGKADFTIDDKYVFEVGGKNKGHEQIMGLKNAYLALDNLEYGFGNKIPLWLFGMLY
ncbi:MAG: AAA family ATPase [Prevotellaceae bacterium]|jgi:predicted AAA+ superfamily ATPase|nr:AAA family ATPase [Prevotellaceae bacterium]